MKSGTIESSSSGGCVYAHFSKVVGLDRLGFDERLALVEELWDSIAADSASIPLTEAQREELDRRIADHEANRDVVVLWEDVKASIANRLKK